MKSIMVCIIAGSAGGVKNNLTHFAANVAVFQGLALARAHAPLVAARASDAAPTVERAAKVLLSRLHGVHSITG